MHPVYLIITFWVGAIIGSFLNVVGLRWLKEESPVFRRSYCYACQAPIAPYDNIPVVSWLLLGGKCRQCKTPISAQYPAVELATALLFVAVVATFGLTWQSAFLLYLVANLMVVMITDFREQYIFNVNSLGLIPFGVAYTGFNLAHDTASPYLFPMYRWILTVPHGLVSALIAAVGAYVFFQTLNFISRLLIGKDGFGLGDAYLLMGVGSFFGLPGIMATFALGFMIQAAFGIPHLFWQWAQQKAYGPLKGMVLGLVLAALPYGLQAWVPNALVVMVAALLCGLIALKMTMGALKEAKELELELNYLPFGPALVAGALLWVFFEPSIRHLVGG